MNKNIENELPWILEARKHIGLKEIKGNKHNSTIVSWLRDLKAWWFEDETAWCGTFVAHCLKSATRFIPKDWFRAKEYVHAGAVLKSPAYGCIVVFSREGGGHVGFVVGKDQLGNLMVLGGNQGDAVNIIPFDRNRVLEYVWPASINGTKILPLDFRYNLPEINSNGKVSTNEA